MGAATIVLQFLTGSHDIRQTMRRLCPDRWEIAVLLLLTGAIGYQLFVDPIVGIADNRDFARLMDPAGLDYRSVAEYRETVFGFVQTKFVHVKPSSHRYLTSERPVLGMAKLVNRLLSKDGWFDLRVLGCCNLLLYVGAIFVFLRAFRTQGTLARSLVSGAVLLMGVDVQWVAYFNSFYCESASLISFFSTVGLALLCIDNQGRGRAAWWLWLGYMSSAFLFWMAKSQNTAFAPCLALGAWCCFPDTTNRTDVTTNSAAPDPRRRRRSHVLRLLGAAAIPVGVVWAFAVNAYGHTTGTNADVVIAEEILPHSPNPADDRRELGEGPGSASLLRIAGFYARHPVRWWRMGERQMKEAFGYLGLGHFTRASGLAPGTQSRAFNVWSELKKAHYPRHPALLVGLFIGFFVLAGMKARWLDEGRSARVRTFVGPVLALGCVLEAIVVVTFEANGTAKHLFLFNVAVDLCLLFALLNAAEVAARAWRRGSLLPGERPRVAR